MSLVEPTFQLRKMTTPARLLVTTFVTLIGFGYLFALLNLYHQHQLADGVPGLTFNDLRVTFHGMVVDESADATQSPPAVPKSRMLEMIEPGGDMRENLRKGGEPAADALTRWLERGALESEFTQPNPIDDNQLSPQSVIADLCLRCHNADDGEVPEHAFGPDLFDTDFQLIAAYSAPGTAVESVETVSESGVRRKGPSSVAHLALVTHIHMLTIPVFTFIVSALFLASGPSKHTVFSSILAVLPMFSLVLDFLSWWLARWIEPFLYVIAITGPIFGAALAIQIVTILAAIWLKTDPKSV
jgi:hypothetical protein